MTDDAAVLEATASTREDPKPNRNRYGVAIQVPVLCEVNGPWEACGAWKRVVIAVTDPPPLAFRKRPVPPVIENVPLISNVAEFGVEDDSHTVPEKEV
jgi:hypothetical protein